MRGPAALRPRERRLALIAGVLIGCWAFLSWLVHPLWEHVRGLRHHVATQTQHLEGLSELLRRAPAIERAYQEAAAYLTVEDDEQAQGAFLHELEALSRTASVRLNLKPRPLRPEERLRGFEVELDVEGSQQQLMTFLDALLRLPKLMTIERLRIAAVPAKADALRASLVLHTLTLRHASP